MLKQPVSVVNYTNVAIVKLKVGRKKFEIACYPNKVQQFRQKVENDINEVLQIDKIFVNAIKGDLAKQNELESLFPNMSYEEIVRMILEKGEIQISEKERNLHFQNVKNDIANIIVEKTYNKETGLPFPQNVILKVLDTINFTIKESEDAKKQGLKAIKLIQEKNILPLERKLMQIFITLKNTKGFNNDQDFLDFVDKFMEFLKTTNSQILEINVDNPKQFKVKCTMHPNHYREILTNYEDILSIEILSNALVIANPNYSNDKTQSLSKSNYDNLLKEKDEIPVDTFKNMKISNQALEKFLADTDEDNNKPKIKKALTCTKCNGSVFYEQDELRKHFKSNWHNFNAKMSARSKESLTAEEYDEYILMHPEMLK